MVHYRGPAEAMESGYAETARRLSVTPGLRGAELLRGTTPGDRWVLLMRWSDMDAFRTWEDDLRRRGHPSPLRPYQDRTRPEGHYEILVET
ncbi:antibiotic biosynthesis monooxygenase [Sphaerisporangium rufum]|uniref:Antibiotic biosynthesis monooxygenase n=2 Tax=Sphaerisporangium rufum TaxID=1381558 RepID=A0A919R7C1_9ACTN|nr:antibiotic biosynthesis monooxygenase [Sphaerisporangium rufum]